MKKSSAPGPPVKVPLTLASSFSMPTRLSFSPGRPSLATPSKEIATRGLTSSPGCTQSEMESVPAPPSITSVPAGS